MKFVPITQLLLMAVAISCRQAPSQKTLHDEQFQLLYIALLEEGERHKNIQPDTAQHVSADSIFRSFNTSEQDFRSTIAAYRADPKNWQRFYDAVIKKLDEKQKQQNVKSRH